MTPANARSRRRLCALPALVVLVALSACAQAGASGASPAAHASANCVPPHYPGVGYFTSLSVTHTTCATGRKVALAYYHCRLAHGGVKGRCPGGVLDFKCSEVRDSIPTEIDARVTCVKGREKVVHYYQQDIS